MMIGHNVYDRLKLKEKRNDCPEGRLPLLNML
jgi:hypothetical protein